MNSSQFKNTSNTTTVSSESTVLVDFEADKLSVEITESTSNFSALKIDPKSDAEKENYSIDSNKDENLINF